MIDELNEVGAERRRELRTVIVILVGWAALMVAVVAGVMAIHDGGWL